MIIKVMFRCIKTPQLINQYLMLIFKIKVIAQIICQIEICFQLCNNNIRIHFNNFHLINNISFHVIIRINIISFNLINNTSFQLIILINIINFSLINNINNSNKIKNK